MIEVFAVAFDMTADYMAAQAPGEVAQRLPAREQALKTITPRPLMSAAPHRSSISSGSGSHLSASQPGNGMFGVAWDAGSDR
ncbi:MAG: hypothetical protein KDB55_13120 [Mycobacterium sp.]|nr:hypothetical protein [Mycobacterium sp.]